MSGPLSLPDDTIEFDVDQPADRPVGLMIGIGVLTLLVLVGLGYLIFGNLTGGGDGTGLGLGGPGGPTAIGGPPSDSPSPEFTDTSTPIPVAATTPATTAVTTPGHTVTPPPSTSTVAVSLSVVNGVMRPQNYTGPDCPGSTLAQATVVAGGPVTITYHWNFAVDGKLGNTPPAAFEFTAAGSHPFNYLFSDLAMPSGKVTATFVVSAPVTKRAAMQYTQECGATASVPVLSAAHPKCGDSIHLSSMMSAGVGPMQISYRWRIPGTIGHPSIQPWDVPVGGGKKQTQSDTFKISNGLAVTLMLDRVTPPPVPGRDVSFQTSITLTCTK